MTDKTTRIRAAWVVGYRQGDHCLYADGEVVYQGIKSSLSVTIIRAILMKRLTRVTAWLALVLSTWMRWAI